MCVLELHSTTLYTDKFILGLYIVPQVISVWGEDTSIKLELNLKASMRRPSTN